MDAHFSRMLRPDMASKADAESYFMPCAKFMGGRMGCVFKRGEKGVGYYYDPIQGLPLDYIIEELNAGNFKRKHDGDDFGSAKRRANNDGELSKEDIERLLQKADDADVVALDHNGLQQLVLSFEKKITKNQKQRVKYADEPSKFVESELELHEEISKLAAVAAAPDLFADFVQMGALHSLLGLLTHENTDISISVLAVLQELIDPETFQEDEDVLVLLESFLENSGLELLVQNLARLDESSEEDANGVHIPCNWLKTLQR